MATQASQTLSTGATGTIIPLSIESDDFKVGFIVTPSGANLTYTVEVTMQSLRNGAVPTRWYPLDSFNNKAVTAVDAGNIFFPVTAVRFKSVSGGMTYDLVQGAAR